ncbi:Caspase-1 [Bagarius yarrelli]|uniref:Caspase-1 n=1 Tax=Bagarius yarrelli TaxID=175774 RepID=A0A556TZ58_BAGYA|nr:Caspase-1 [Bagarius yarrelli]
MSEPREDNRDSEDATPLVFLRNLIPLTPSVKEFFEQKLGEITAARFCTFKTCPGCQTYVERADENNLCVHCTVCTAKKGSSYEFCWNCRRKWKGRAQIAVRCGYSDCNQIYPTMEKSNDRKRLAMIINNVNFKVSQFHRSGAEKDEESMGTLLEALGYDVITLNDLSAEGMEAAVRDFSQRNEHRYSDSTFFVIMSHGGHDGIYGINYDGNESDIFPVDKIFHYLNSENCPGLTDKPKIILIQACRGDTVSIRNTGYGSVFIQSLVKVFIEHCHVDDIVELFRKVTLYFEEAVKKTNFPYQMPSLDRTTLAKKFYLFPGL